MGTGTDKAIKASLIFKFEQKKKTWREKTQNYDIMIILLPNGHSMASIRMQEGEDRRKKCSPPAASQRQTFGYHRSLSLIGPTCEPQKALQLERFCGRRGDRHLRSCGRKKKREKITGKSCI